MRVSRVKPLVLVCPQLARAARRYLAVEWGPLNIRVNAVAPWFIRTPLTEPILRGALLDNVLRRTPMGRTGECNEVSQAVLFLASQAASYSTCANRNAQCLWCVVVSAVRPRTSAVRLTNLPLETMHPSPPLPHLMLAVVRPQSPRPPLVGARGVA
jgi:hypothetical protein